ncbi:hypothetical protein PVK06_029165 [Gossypium arboreum]|uniref:Uncharacterized protein n=1 Tax=Gossypium arboreum TaxID=29729 RepID=A0ABR0P5V2_GOSAR|nr:hypothetical protein PVK06_029165 [Gossypium arboreum]
MSFNLTSFFNSSFNQTSSRGLNDPHLIDKPPWGAFRAMVTGFALWPVTLAHSDIYNSISTSHRRSVSASLVKGVSERERDRQVELRGGSETLAPQWWKFFNFKLVNELVNEDDESIFGAIFEYVLPSATNPGPRYVIAFWGTLFKRETWKRDLESDFAIILNTLHQISRVQTAMKYVEDRVSKAGSSKV